MSQHCLWVPQVPLELDNRDMAAGETLLGLEEAEGMLQHWSNPILDAAFSLLGVHHHELQGWLWGWGSQEWQGWDSAALADTPKER